MPPKPDARFTVTLVATPGVDGVRALRWLLKRARRQFGLIAVDVREEEGARSRRSSGR